MLANYRIKILKKKKTDIVFRNFDLIGFIKGNVYFGPSFVVINLYFINKEKLQ